MTKDESINFIKKIKAYFYYFSLDKDTTDIWINKLKPYSLEDVEARFEKHLKSDDNKELPRLHELTKNLVPENEKSKNKEELFVDCRLCNKIIGLSKYDKHYGRCLTIEFIMMKLKEEGKDVLREEIEKCKDDVLERLYQKYNKFDRKDILDNIPKMKDIDTQEGE